MRARSRPVRPSRDISTLATSCADAVALCIASDPSAPLVEEVRKAFAAVFPAGTHLDVLFVSAVDIPRLEQVCPAFFRPG